MSTNTENHLDNKGIYDKLIVAIHNNISTRLSDLMSKLLNSMQDKLFDMSNEAVNNEDQTRYFELMNQIRALKTTIADNFNENITEYLVPAKEFEEKQKKKKPDDDYSELSLVAQDAMEGIVLVKGIGERAGAKYREQLSHLDARFEHLALQTSKIFKKDALLPTNFCQAFDDALAGNFENTNKKLLFSLFETEVTSKLEGLYDSINNRLIDADVLPQIKLGTGKQPASRPPKAPPSPAEENMTDDMLQEDIGGHSAGGTYSGGSGNAGGGDAGGSAGGSMGGTGSANAGNNIAGFAMTAAPGGTYNRAGQSAQPSQTNNKNAPHGESHSSGDDYAGSQGGVNTNPTDNQNTASGSAEYQHYTAGMPASRVGRVLGNYIGGSPITPGIADKSSEQHGEFFPASTHQHFGHQEIIQALSRLPEFDHPEETRFDGEAIKRAVLAEIAKTSGGAVTRCINQIAEKTIDFIELIFDAISDDDDISDTMKALLLRLQIPVIKASMSDQEFFIYDTHPARVLLDTIADVGVGITDHEDDMYKHLDKVISTILDEPEQSTETFQTALDTLNDYIEAQEAISRAQEEAAQLQVLRGHARTTVLKALRVSTSGKALPEAVHPLILKRWPTLLFTHYLTKGKENDEWVNMVLTLRHVVESVQPIRSAENLAKVIAEKDTLLGQVESYLNISNKSKKDVQEILMAYSDTLQEHIDDANYTEEEVSFAKERIRRAKPVEEAPIEEEIINRPEIPANVMPGMWFQIFMGEDEIPRRCKLSVIIVEDANLIFVTHKGELIAEKSFEEFNEELTNGTSKMIMGHSAFDHAFKSVIDRLN